MTPFDFQRNDLTLTLTPAGTIPALAGYRVAAQWRSHRHEAGLALARPTVDVLAGQWTQATGDERAVAQNLYQALASAGVAFEPWLKATQDTTAERRDPTGEQTVTYALTRLVVRLEALELIPLPWEAIDDRWTRRNTLVVRAVEMPPAEAARPLELPLHLLQVGEKDIQAAQRPDTRSRRFGLARAVDQVFGRIHHVAKDDIVRVCTAAAWADVAGAGGSRWPRHDLVHLNVVDAIGTAGGWELCLDGQPGSRSLAVDPLERWLRDQHTRLLVLEIVSGNRAARSTALVLAHRLASNGGPAVLVTCFSARTRQGRAFFEHYYEQLLHDVPLDHAFFVNWTDEGYARPSPGKQGAWLRGADVQLIAGPGGEDLLRFKPVLHETEGETVQIERGIDHLQSDSKRWEEALVSVALDKADRELQRTVNTWLVAGRSVGQGRILASRERLELGAPYLLHVDIGPQVAGGPSIVVNPVELQDIADAIFEYEDQAGVMLEVALFGEGLRVGPARQEPPPTDEAWRRPLAQWCGAATDWLRPTTSEAVGHLWLARARPTPPLYFSVQPRRPGRGRLRLCIYYRSNLVQSLLVEARIVRPGQEGEPAQLAGLGPARRARLAAAGVHSLGDLALAQPGAIAGAARVGLPVARAWVEEAGRLEDLGNRARVEYTTSAAFMSLREMPRRALTIVTNQDPQRGSHFVGLKKGEWDDETGQADDYVYGKTLAEDQVKSLQEAIRSHLGAIYTEFDSGTGEPRRYVLGRENRAAPIGLARALYPLAVKGRRLYTTFFDAQAQEELAGKLQAEGQVLHMARVVGNLVIPWAAAYDRRLDYDDLLRPKYVCLHALKQMEQGEFQGCGSTGRPPGPNDQPQQALRQAQQPEDAKQPGFADVDVYFYDDLDICPQSVHGEQHVVCPWAFWGFKHQLEQPPQQLTEARPQPRDLRRSVLAQATPRISVNVSMELDLLSDHLKFLRELGASGMRTILEAGEDGQDAQGRIIFGRDKVVENLHDRELSIIYFYCHGGSEGSPPEAFLAVGSSQRQQIRPVTLDNEQYLWDNAPLVFVNGCKTVRLEPDLFSGFVDRFAQRGAAGVIGTEVSVWEYLAREVGEEFLERFLQGEATVGEILLDIRRDLLTKNNPLGLVYTNYCASDLRLVA